MRDGHDFALQPKGPERPFTSLLGRKRESGIPEEQDADKLPEKWRKTPKGSVLTSPVTPASHPMPVPTLRKGNTYSVESTRNGRAKAKNQKRRKSFDECATSDDAPPTAFMGLNGTGFSLSAPNSFVPVSSLSSIRPLAAFHQGKDYLLSPASSTSSVFDSGSLVGEQPANMMMEDHARFLTQESLDRKQEDCDPSTDDYEFLPMEEFEWCIASSIIADYLDGTVELLDRHFKEALDADAEEEGLFKSQTAMLARQQASEPLANGDDTSCVIMFDEIAESERGERRQKRNSESRSASVPPRDNKSIKEAAWYYSLRLLNIQKDDFRYSDIKYLLDKGARRYLKRVCTQPEMISHADWVGVQGMRNEEKCLLSLLACQARFLGEVLWSMKACSDYIG